MNSHFMIGRVYKYVLENLVGLENVKMHFIFDEGAQYEFVILPCYINSIFFKDVRHCFVSIFRVLVFIYLFIYLFIN